MPPCRRIYNAPNKITKLYIMFDIYTRRLNLFPKTMEQVLSQFCKDCIGVNRSSHNYMALGEIGRQESCVGCHFTYVENWCKLIYMPVHRYPHDCYDMLKRHVNDPDNKAGLAMY